MELIAEAVVAGDVRADLPADELASYCLNSITAPGGLTSKTTVHPLVAVTLASLHPPD